MGEWEGEWGNGELEKGEWGCGIEGLEISSGELVLRKNGEVGWGNGAIGNWRRGEEKGEEEVGPVFQRQSL